MKKTKIAVIGAASTTFGPKLLRDMAHYKALSGSELSLMDIDADRLAVFAKLAKRVSNEAEVDYKVKHTRNQKKALDGADFVIISVAVNRAELWQSDFEIPLKHGIKHVTAECGGPGALLHTMRNVPIMLEIARDIEELCPDALVMVCSNPEARLTLALKLHSNVKAIGLCHGVEIILQPLARLLNVNADELEVTAAGVNHFTWILDLKFGETGEDAYTLLRERLKDHDPNFHPLTRKMWDVFGLLPSPGDNHIGEFLPYAWEFCGLNGPGFEGRKSGRQSAWEKIVRQANGDEPLDPYLSGRTWADTLAFPIINGIVNNCKTRMPALNLRNDGYIRNLPPEAIVEVPAMIDGNGIKGIQVGELPSGIAALCKREIDMHKLSVEAAVTGDRQIAMQAFLVDPVVWSVQAAEKALDELLEVEAEYLPQFKHS